MNAGAVDFFENLLGGKIWGHAAPVKGQAAEGENDNERGEGEHFILAGGFRELRGYKQEGNEDQCQGDDTANQHEERMGQARKGIWHGLVFRQNLQNLQNEKMGRCGLFLCGRGGLIFPRKSERQGIFSPFLRMRASSRILNSRKKR